MNTRLLISLALGSAGIVSAQRVGAPTDDLTNLSVDDLFQLEVTSVGRKAQELSKAPAAIYVLTAEDIRRSGATSIPEALEGVPGLTVQRVDGRMWDISARGFARLFSDKMLVMIDGRSLYTPLFSGVIWDLIDVPLENIERIEIVRGPGAVMWGPNAVNGVINIITKKARDTKGGLVSVGGGNDVYGSVLARWAAAPTERLAYQVWTKLEDQNPADSSQGSYAQQPGVIYTNPVPITDLNTQSARLGFRLEDHVSDKDQVSVEGDVFKLGGQDSVRLPEAASMNFEHGDTSATGGFVQARWTRTNSPGNESSLQFTFDKNQIDYPFVGGDTNNLTVDFQKRLQTSDRNEVYWGVGYQRYWDSSYSGGVLGFQPPSDDYSLGDVVLRDEFQLVPNRLLASAGVRVDYTSYSHFDFQPSVRLVYTPSARQSLWLALSRAIRVPSRVDRDLTFYVGDLMLGQLPIREQVQGSESMQPEVENSLELGYRFQSGQRWSADFATFWSYYTSLASLAMPQHLQVQMVDGVPELAMSFIATNAATARSYGGEASATWQLTPAWRLRPSYSYLDVAARLPPDHIWMLDTSGYRHQGAIRSQYDLSRHWQLDLTARVHSRNAVWDLPGTVLFDARVGWQPSRDTEFSFSMQDLTGREVVEAYTQSPFASIPTRRTFLVRLVQRF
ncbi:MAG TPA: TonB-dependent receptor [Bryobacteraceae bacterium]|nr:TonB-dependent receptor [Bryobacteraceae bacterium]